MGQLSESHALGGGLKSRHVTMLSIAGVIGASLFVGSSVAIAEAGPAVLLAYLFAGLLVVMIMRMLAEMAVATPDTGSFSTYADKAIGPCHRLVILVVLGAGYSAGGQYCRHYSEFMDTGYSGVAIFISDYACLNWKQFIERQKLRRIRILAGAM